MTITQLLQELVDTIDPSATQTEQKDRWQPLLADFGSRMFEAGREYEQLVVLPR